MARIAEDEWPIGAERPAVQRERDRHEVGMAEQHERGAWQRAADERERRLGEWIRDTCNDAAAQRPHGKGKP
jgi:hypothetical protein